MPDGARLAARLWLPEGAEDAPLPALLEYIPYRRRDGTRLRDEGMHPYLAANGYACLRVDIRGSGDSDGVMLDEYSDREMRDGADVVQWIADQPWCDGNVGMFGKSWGAFTSFQVASLRPSALKAILPVMGTDDRWLEDIHFAGGVLSCDNFWWGSIMQLFNAAPPDPETAGEDRWREVWKTRLDAMTYWPAQWLEHQPRDETWWRGSICTNYDDVQIPVFFVGGWADHYRDTPFRISEHLKGPVKVLMGPWAHLFPHEATPRPRVDFIAEATRFWDRWLKGKESGIDDEPPLRFWMQDAVRPAGLHAERPGRWVEEPSWPSPNVTDRTLWLNHHTLGDAPRQEDEAMSISSPQTFGQAGGDMFSFALEGDTPADCRMDAGGALLFRSEPLQEATDILGQPSVTLEVVADRPQAFVVALLVDEAPDGAQTLITRGFCNLMLRNSETTPEPVVQGEVMNVTLSMRAMAYNVPAGHRVMVQIASAYWPLLWPAPQPVTLTLAPGRSALALPVRTAPQGEATPRPLPEPSTSHLPQPEAQLREGAFERSLTVDQTTGAHVARVFSDGGVFGPVGKRRLDTGTARSEVSDRIYSITPDDPLSAKASMTQESEFERGDWHVRISTWAEQTATESDFHVRAGIRCWDGDELFHEAEWNHVIPRNGM
jgi:hypothetical protein